jgi:hypothetical protein
MTTQLDQPPAKAPLSPARRWVLGVGATLSLLAIAWGVLTMINLLGRTTETSTQTLRPDSPAISVRTSGGGITVAGGDVGEVTVRTRLTYGLGKPRLVTENGPDGLDLSVDCPWYAFNCSAAYDIVVPRAYTVRARSSGGGIHVSDVVSMDVDTSGGGITARGIANGVRGDTSGGGVTLDDVGGTIDVHSSGGGITGNGIRGGSATAGSSGGGVRLRFSVAPERVDVDSSGGGVEVTLPREGGPYRVDARSSGGNEVVQVPTDPSSNRTISAHSSGGSVRVQLADEG